MKKIILIMGLLWAPAFSYAAFLSAPKTVDELKKKLAALPPERNFRERSVLLSDLGTALYDQGHWEEAAQAFDDALGYGPPTVLKKHIYLYLGKSYESSGRIDKAISAYEQAVMFDKKNWRRHRDLAGLYETVNLHEKAIDSYKRALVYNPKDSAIHFALGRIYRELFRYEEAETNLVAASDQGYNPAEIFAELSLVFEAQGKFSEAASACNETLTDASVPADWARLIYLSLLGRRDELVDKGFAGLKKKNASEETIRFYQALQRYIAGNRTVDNPQLLALFKDILQ